MDESGVQALDLTTLRRLKKVSLSRCRLSSARVWSPELKELRLEECHGGVAHTHAGTRLDPRRA